MGVKKLTTENASSVFRIDQNNRAKQYRAKAAGIVAALRKVSLLTA
jgi:hypothetical protein